MTVHNQFLSQNPGMMLMPNNEVAWEGFVKDLGLFTTSVESGTFSPGNYTGFSTAPTIVLSWVKFYNIVCLYENGTAGSEYGDSDQTDFTFDGLPAVIRPTGTVFTVSAVLDDGISKSGCWVIASDGSVDMKILISGVSPPVYHVGGWKTSGDKGLPLGTPVFYSVGT